MSASSSAGSTGEATASIDEDEARRRARHVLTAERRKIAAAGDRRDELRRVLRPAHQGTDVTAAPG